MELRTAIEKLHDAVKRGTGASAGAATVLLFGYNAINPMRNLLSLDSGNRAAALTVIEAAFHDQLDGGRVVEEIVGSEKMEKMFAIYGVDGTAWQD